MFERIHVKNFRILKDVEIGDLSRINLITGLNNSGKTSLLEAMYLLSVARDPTIAVNPDLRAVLEASGGPVGGDDSSAKVQWDKFFSDMNPDNPVKISGDHADGRMALEIQSTRSKVARVSLDSPGRSSNGDGAIGLSFLYTAPDGSQIKSKARLEKGELDVSTPDESRVFTAFLVHSGTGNLRNDAVALAGLRVQKRDGLVLKALRVVEPRLRSVEDSVATGYPVIHGDIGLPEMVPLSVMGQGMTQVVQLVLSISYAQGGVVLVDEIETGLHHSIMPHVWKVVDEAARGANVQVFATTHSFECIEAAHETLAPDDFRLHRLDLVDSNVRCVTYTPESIGAAIRHNLEVR